MQLRKLVILPLAAAAVGFWAPPASADGPWTYDTDNDGVIDTYCWDTNGDGRFDAVQFDFDGNGVTEIGAIDSNNNGRFDFFGLDRNQDKKIEIGIVDSNEDTVLDFIGFDLNQNTKYEEAWKKGNDGTWVVVWIDRNENNVQDSEERYNGGTYQNQRQDMERIDRSISESRKVWSDTDDGWKTRDDDHDGVKNKDDSHPRDPCKPPNSTSYCRDK